MFQESGWFTGLLLNEMSSEIIPMISVEQTAWQESTQIVQFIVVWTVILKNLTIRQVLKMSVIN